MEENLNKKIKEIQNKFDEKNNLFKDLNANYNKLDKEYKDLVNFFIFNFILKLILFKFQQSLTNSNGNINNNNNNINATNHKSNEVTNNNQINKGNLRPLIKKEIFDIKFSTQKYDDKYIVKCLQKDILDFQDFVKEGIKVNRTYIDELIRLTKLAVNETIPDYDVHIYGSHSTNLCLPWSDLDIVLVSKKGNFVNNFSSLQSLYINLYDKPWIKSIKFIDGAIIPIIKLVVSDEFNSMQMDISLQDSKHFGLKCVELVRSFMNEYEALEPLIFALKNLLKNANLNDPYTVK
jgi:DNA polymerase sigma